MEVDIPKLQLYLVQVNVVAAGREGFDLAVSIKKISEVLRDYDGHTKCLYRYKVTGETKILAVYEVTNVIGLERMVNGLTLLGYVDIVCDPLCTYEGFAKRIGVSDQLTAPSPRNLESEQCLWADFTVEYTGKTMEDLLSTWKSEAETALGARQKGGKLELYKVCGQRKVHLFTESNAEEWDNLTFKLPLMQLNGDKVKIVTKGLQNLDFYVSKILAD